MDTKTVTLGGRTWDVPALPFGVTKKVFAAMQRISAKAFDESSIDEIVKAVQIGLQKVDSSITVDTILDMNFTLDDLKKVLDVIAEQCGLQKGKISTGEAPAGETSTGTT